MSAELKNGDEVCIIESGQLAILNDVNPHPDYAARDEVWAEAIHPDGISYFYLDDPSEVELVRRAEDIPTRTLPTAKEIAEHVSTTSLGGFGEGLVFDETDTNEPDGELLAYGKSATGQRFACRIKITEIVRTDY